MVLKWFLLLYYRHDRMNPKYQLILKYRMNQMCLKMIRRMLLQHNQL